LLTVTLIYSQLSVMPAAFGNPALADANTTSESTANTAKVARQILKTGISLNSPALSPNSLQLANTIGLTPVLERIQSLRSRVDSYSGQPTLDSLTARQDLWDAVQKATLLIQKTGLEIDFACAELKAEKEVCAEILSDYTEERDKAVARMNATSFISNAILWTACEAMSIPSINTTFSRFPRHHCQWPIPSGIVGIVAGIVPSAASLYTFKQMTGKRMPSEVDPNMLAKLFNYPVSGDIDYPKTVWTYLNQPPAGNPTAKTRKDQLIDRWVADSNIPGFTDRASKKQLDALTASAAQAKGLSIGTLNTRHVMLEQLDAEIQKMKRMLLELNMAVQGEKQLAIAPSFIDQ
jgi:hypothetical protein